MKFKLFYRNAFSEFNAATLANLTDKQMLSISLEYGIDISRVRGVVDNANQILEVNESKIIPDSNHSLFSRNPLKFGLLVK